MTFTIIARDAETGVLGIGIATYSAAVGGLCPFISPGVGAVSIQARGDPALGPMAMDLLAMGMEPQAVLVELARADRDHFPFCQIGIVSANGDSAVHNGRGVNSWAGHIAGDGFIAMGNSLASSEVVQAMANKYELQPDTAFAECLLSVLEAGRSAEGQVGRSGANVPERSAAMLIYGEKRAPELDLRVDLHTSAVEELRRVYEARLRELQDPDDIVWPDE